MEPELDMKKYCRLVDIFYNYNLNTGAYWHLQFTRRKGLLMIAAIRKRPTAGIADINSKHNWLSRSQFPRSVFLIHFKEKRKKNYWMIMGQDAQHPYLSQEEYQSKWQQEIKFHLREWLSWLYANSKWGKELRDDGIPLHAPCEWTLATAPRKDSLHRQQWKISRELSLGF